MRRRRVRCADHRHSRSPRDSPKSESNNTSTAGLQENDLPRCYETYCDPRLNYAQAMEAALRMARELKK